MALVYSCCFWFSLRLGGIIIGVFSLFQAAVVLIACCVAYTHAEMVEEIITDLSENYKLVYSEDLLTGLMEDPKKYITIAIVFKCIYIVTCVLYIYGAYIFNNILMMSFIILELFRLICILALVATGLLLLKENTMDIGSLIGASVVGGFFLLGMFYLWVCATNLPILINEMEQDEQDATIAKLQQMLDGNQRPRRDFDNYRYVTENQNVQTRNVFVVSNKSNPLKPVQRSRIPIPY